MQEKQLIQKIQELREIQPRKDWVLLTKSRIFSEEPVTEEKWHSALFFLRYKLALAPVVSVLIVVGLLGFAQNTVPGNFLFSVKKITETVQVGFTSSVEKPKVHLELANKRLMELSKIAEVNQVKNLGPAIEEFQASLAQATQDLTEMNANVTSSDDPLVLQGIANETKTLGENKEMVEAILGTMVGDTGELESVLSQIEKQTVAYLIEDLETRTLTVDDQDLLERSKEYFEAGDYSSALEEILYINK